MSSRLWSVDDFRKNIGRQTKWFMGSWQVLRRIQNIRFKELLLSTVNHRLQNQLQWWLKRWNRWSRFVQKQIYLYQWHTYSIIETETVWKLLNRKTFSFNLKLFETDNNSSFEQKLALLILFGNYRQY